MEKTLFTFRKWDYQDMKVNLQELFQLVAYLDDCSVGKTEDMQKTLDAIYTRIRQIQGTLNVKYLFPSEI